MAECALLDAIRCHLVSCTVTGMPSVGSARRGPEVRQHAPAAACRRPRGMGDSADPREVGALPCPKDRPGPITAPASAAIQCSALVDFDNGIVRPTEAVGGPRSLSSERAHSMLVGCRIRLLVQGAPPVAPPHVRRPAGAGQTVSTELRGSRGSRTGTRR